MKRETFFLWIVAMLVGTGVAAQGSHAVALSSNQPAELFAHAGSDTALTMSGTLILGDIPSATGGTPPYSFYWLPGNDLDSDTVANPAFAHLGFVYAVEFFLMVTDSRRCTARDSVTVVLLYHSVDEPSAVPLKFYPVPATSYMTVELPVPGGELSITTIDGRLLEKHQVDQNRIHLALSHLPRGVYLLNWQQGEQRRTVRIMLK